MKKVVAIIMVLMIFVSALCCFAEEEPFYPGTFHVGKDFKAGGYNIHLTKVGKKNPKVYIKIYENEEAFSKGNTIVIQHFATEGYHLAVSDGMVFEIQMLYDGVLTIVNETPSWMIANG